MTLHTVDTGTSNLWRWTCSLEIVHAFPQFWFSNPQTILCSSFFSPCSVWYTQTHNTKVESTFLHFNWLQFELWFLYYQHLLLATGEFKYKLKEHHMLEIQLFLTILKRCQSFCPVHFWSSVWNDSRFGFFLRFFCVFPMQTKWQGENAPYRDVHISCTNQTRI